jgi:DNA-binding response OmpR family regulator
LPRKVLIVEDNAIVRNSLEKLLAMEGFYVIAASTLREGHAKLDGQAAVILDLDLPDGSGLDLLKRIRAERRPTKVFVTSGSCDGRLLRQVKQFQPDAMLCKPVNFRELVKLLEPA